MEESKLPACVGFIMDGNRRWAKNRGLPSIEGHRVGHETFRTIVNCVYELLIPHVVCYAFSTENWHRTKEEVGYLMELLAYALRTFSEDIRRDGKRINLHIIGERAQLPASLQEEIRVTEALNTHEPQTTVWIALAYGGRAEIVAAVNRAVETGIQVTEETFSELLYTKGMPDPDLIIRTSGEERLSNFLLWQSAYSELFFVETPWPDFGETEFKGILEQYANRHRRKGA